MPPFLFKEKSVVRRASTLAPCKYPLSDLTSILHSSGDNGSRTHTLIRATNFKFVLSAISSYPLKFAYRTKRFAFVGVFDFNISAVGLMRLLRPFQRIYDADKESNLITCEERESYIAQSSLSFVLAYTLFATASLIIIYYHV